MLYGIDTDISPNDSFLASMATRPWMKQALQIKTMAGPGNPAQKWPQVSNIQSFDDFLVRMGQTVVPGGPVVSMAAGEGVLAAIGTMGVFTYSRSDFVVADQGRIAMFDPAGNPTFELTTSGNAGDDEGGNAGNAQPIVRPSRAYPLSTNEILVADPGANRVFRVNRGGTETRAISKFKLDPQHAAPANFPANGPLALKSPTDVLTYTSIEAAATVQNFFTSSGGYEYWTHYLIADTGNRRLVEVVDRYAYDPVNRRIGNAIDIGGKPQLGVLLWHSPPATQGKGYEYNSLSRIFVAGRYVYVAGIGTALPTSTDVGNNAPNVTAPRETAGFGGVAVFDPLAPNGVTVFNKIALPAFSANVFWNDVTGAFDSAARPIQNKPLINVSSVTARPITLADDSTVVSIMITDATGVYEVTYAPLSIGGEYIPSVQWMLPNEVYRVMRRAGPGNGVPTAENPRDLRATYARRLESGEVLVVNGYFGQTRGIRNADGTFAGRQPYRGEVVQVSGESGLMRTNVANMGFGLRSITFNLELNTSTRGLVLPVFADRR